MASKYHRLVRGMHSRWEKGVGKNPDTDLPNPGRRVIYRAGDPANFPDTMADLSDEELATLGNRVQEVDGPAEDAEEPGKVVAPSAKATTPVRPRDYDPRTSGPNSPLDNLQPLPAVRAPKDYSGIADLNAPDAAAVIAEASTADEVRGLMAAEEKSGKSRKTVLDAGERRLAQLEEE